MHIVRLLYSRGYAVESYTAIQDKLSTRSFINYNQVRSSISHISIAAYFQ